MGRKKKEQILEFNYNFFSGKYILGDPLNLFEEKEANKIIKHLNKSKELFGYDSKYNLYFFKLQKADEVDDYIEDSKPLKVPSKILVLSNHSKDGKLFGITRINQKYNFKLYGDYKDEILYMYFQTLNEPGFFSIVSEIYINSK